MKVQGANVFHCQRKLWCGTPFAFFFFILKNKTVTFSQQQNSVFLFPKMFQEVLLLAGQCIFSFSLFETL